MDKQADIVRCRWKDAYYSVPKQKEKMKSGSIVTANLQKVSFVHFDTKCEVLPTLNNIYGSRTIFINQPLWLKSSKCKSR